MPGMELARTKIPSLPPYWTAGRGIRYAAKLGVFILVPGLHQIACRRWILGGLLMALYFAAEFTLSNMPIDFTRDYFATNRLARNTGDVCQYFAWVLLAVDLKNLHQRKSRLNSFLILSCLIGIYFLPNHSPKWLFIHVVAENYACPAFCKNDIVEYVHFERGKHNIAKGDHVIVQTFLERTYLAKVYVESHDKACAEDIRFPLYLPRDDMLYLPISHGFCQKISDRYPDDFIVSGGPNPTIKTLRQDKFSPIADYNLHGFRPKKIGTTHEHFILSDGITDIAGNVLLTIFKWTNLDFLDLKRNSPD
jgi:hypothetical protein